MIPKTIEKRTDLACSKIDIDLLEEFSSNILLLFIPWTRLIGVWLTYWAGIKGCATLGCFFKDCEDFDFWKQDFHRGRWAGWLVRKRMENDWILKKMNCWFKIEGLLPSLPYEWDWNQSTGRQQLIRRRPIKIFKHKMWVVSKWGWSEVGRVGEASYSKGIYRARTYTHYVLLEQAA